MTLTGLALRNLGRNRFRVGLTILGVAITIVAFLLLRTVVWAWNLGSQYGVRDRVVTRHKVTFILPLPMRYVQDVRDAPHIRAATWADWFGGKDPKHETEFFTTLAVDQATFFIVYDELKVAPDALRRFQQDRQGAIVGDVLARKLGWKVGDQIVLQSGMIASTVQLTIDGIYTATAKSVDRSTLFFQWDYFNDNVSPARRDMVGWIVSRVDDPSRAADIGMRLDKLFDDRDTQTLSQDERSFSVSTIAMYSAVLRAIDIVSAVMLIILTLVLGNTIAMAARERTNEYGVLRAIGFLPGHIVLWVVAESLVMGALGGVLGAIIGWPFINLFVGRLIEDNLGAYLPYFRLETVTALLGVALAAVLGAAAATVPAWRAAGLHVVDALRRVA
jgi:putative ABC transport system permease protein